jgi:hypothetical protein
MIPEYKFYHGAVLADLIDRSNRPIQIDELDEPGRLLNYALNGDIGIQIKYSSARLGPWSFTFSPSNIEDLEDLGAKFRATFVVLVCHDDGFACIPGTDSLSLLKGQNQTAWLRAERGKRRLYRIAGTNGELGWRVKVTTEPIVAALFDNA